MCSSATRLLARSVIRHVAMVVASVSLSTGSCMAADSLRSEAVSKFGAVSSEEIARSIVYYTDHAFFSREDFHRNSDRIKSGVVDWRNIPPDLGLIDMHAQTLRVKRWRSPIAFSVEVIQAGDKIAVDLDLLANSFRQKAARYAPVADTTSTTTSLVVITGGDFDIPHDFVAQREKENLGGGFSVLELSPPPGRGFIAYWPVRCFIVVASSGEIIRSLVQIKVHEHLDRSALAQHILEGFDRCLLPMLAGVRGEMRRYDDKQDLALRFLYLDQVEPGMTYASLVKVYERYLTGFSAR